MGVKAPVYVAGFDLGVLPIGDWVMFTTLSIKWLPLRFLYFPSLSFVLLIVFDRAGYSVSIIKLDFPLPETPDTQQNKPNGIFKLTFF